MYVIRCSICCFFLLLIPVVYLPAQENKVSLSLSKDSIPKMMIAEAQANIQAGRYDIAILALEGMAEKRRWPMFQKELLPLIYLNLGGAYLFKGDYENCIAYLHQAASIAEDDPDKYRAILVRIYNNLSVALNRIVANEEALKYLDKAEQIAVTYKYNRLIAGILVNRGRIYKEMGLWDKSKDQFEIALAFIDSIQGLEKAIGISAREIRQIVITNTGQLFLQQGKPEQALVCFKQAEQLSRAGTNPYNSIPALLGLGKAYAALDSHRIAERYLSDALAISRQKKVAEGETEALQNLSRLYAAKGDYNKAYTFRLAFDEKENEIRSAGKIKEIKGLEVRYSIAEKDRQIVESKLQIVQQQKHIVQKNTWIYGITIGSLMVLVTGFVAYGNLRYKQRNQKNQILLLQQEKEINQLKALMQGEEKERKRIAHELHDGIGGMLAAIKMHFSAFKRRHEPHTDLDELTQLLSMLDETSDEVRKTAHNLMPTVLLKHSLGSALTSYCNYISARGGLDIQFFEYQLPENLPKDFELMMYRTAQELVQNILKHAEASKAVIELEYRNEHFNLTVEDNGKGFDTGLETGKGYGLQHIAFKVQALKGHIHIESAPHKGTTISVTFKGAHILQSFYKV